MNLSLPRLVRLEIMLCEERAARRLMIGVLPRGAKLRPSLAGLDSPVSSAHWISAVSALARLASAG
jgi:hypothetical protein